MWNKFYVLVYNVDFQFKFDKFDMKVVFCLPGKQLQN